MDALDARGDQHETEQLGSVAQGRRLSEKQHLGPLGTLHISQNVTMSLTNKVLRGLKNGAFALAELCTKEMPRASCD